MKRSDREWLASKLIEPLNSTTENVEQGLDEKSAVVKRPHKMRSLSAEVELLGNLPIRDFTQEELDADPLLVAILEDRRTR